MSSFKDVILSAHNTTIGVDNEMLPYWLGVLEFYSLDLVNWESFEYYGTFCGPNNPFKKYDILFTQKNAYYYIHFYGNDYLFDFFPVKTFPHFLKTSEPFPAPFAYAISSDKQTDYLSTNLYMYFRYGNLSQDDISFIKFYTGVKNITVDYESFIKMMNNASNFYNTNMLNINPIPSDYISNIVTFGIVSTFAETDYWHIPCLSLIMFYFLCLFISRLFLKPSMKIRLYVPYLPVLLIIQEIGNANYIYFYCSEWIGYIRIFIFCFVCFSYGFTVLRIYYLRNIYAIMYSNVDINEKRFKRMKFLATKKFALIAIPLVSFIMSFLLTLQCIALFFEIGQTTRFSITNISFPIYPIIGALFGLFAVIVDIKLNWKQIKENGLRKFLLWDDVYNIRIDLMLMSVLLVLVIAIVVLFAIQTERHASNALLWLAYLVFTLICGGSTLIKELIIYIRKDRTPKSELEKLLENNSFRQLFKEYSTKEMSLENYMFYEKLRDLVSKYGMSGFIPLETLKEIESQFFKQDSTYELNIPSRTRKLFYALFENYEIKDSSSAELIETYNHSSTKVSDLYTIIYSDLYINMSDTHSRLIETNVFQNWFAVFNIQRKQSIVIV